MDQQPFNIAPSRPSNSSGPARKPLTSGGGTPWRLLVASLILLVLVVLIYCGMNFGYEPYLSNQIQKYDKQLASLTSNMSEQDQQASLAFYSQLYNIKNLGSNHVYASKIFDALEKNTLIGVRVTNVQVAMGSGGLQMTGLAPSFDTVVQQVAAWKNDSMVSSAILESSKTAPATGGTTFSIRVSFIANAFK